MTEPGSLIELLLEAELERAARDGITLEQAPEVQGDGTALGGYLAGVGYALAVVRGEVAVVFPGRVSA